MALDPKLLDSLPNTLVDMYGLVEIDILQDMARRISTYDYFIPAAMHQMQKLQELGMVQEEVIKRLAALTGQTTAEIVELLSEASVEAVEDDVEYYTRADVYEPSKVNTEALHKQLNAGLLQTEQAFFNITRTTANTASKQFERALDRAWTQINSGGFDYNTAIMNAIKDLARDGIGSIEYKSGRIDNIEVAVRRAVVTGANQTALKTQEVLADELEIDLVEVTAHGGARPEHAKWQGKVYSRKGRVTIDGVTYEDFETATRYGHGDGLGGWNCRHTFRPYVPGTSRSWSDKELKALEEKKITYNGEKYTEYEASQIQRGIERDIRKQKRTVAAIEAVGGDASAERKALKEAQKNYTDFTEQTGMRKQSARTQIASAKAEREVRKANKAADVKTSTKKDIEKQRETSQNINKSTRDNLGNSSIEKSSQNGIINSKVVSSKVNASGEVLNPMSAKRYNTMKKNIESKGHSVVAAISGDDLRYLRAIGAEAIADEKGIMHMGEIPSASAFFEEIIHLNQIEKYGKIKESDFVERAAREVAANRKLLANGKAYGFTDDDFAEIKANLELWENDFKKRTGVSYDESGIIR